MLIMQSHYLQRPGTPESQAVPDDSVRQGDHSSLQEMAIETEDSDIECEPMVIQLDRPCDDEIVQAYVRTGEKMSARMHRVGDICGKDAPRRILKLGIKLLKGSSNSPEDIIPGWGVENSYIECLSTITRRATTSGTEIGSRY